MTWLPIVVTLALGLPAIVVSIPQFDLTLRIIISVFLFLILLVGGIVIFLRSTHFKQDSLWELYTFIFLNREKVDNLQFDKLIGLQKMIAKIQRTESLGKKPYDELVRQTKEMICSPDAAS